MTNEHIWEIVTDSFWKIFFRGISVTIPLTVIAFSLALIIAVVMALVQFANIRTQTDCKILHLDFPWNTAFGTVVCRLLRTSKYWNLDIAISGSGAGVCTQ